MRQNKTYDEWLEQFVSGVIMTQNVDYSSKKAIKKNNIGNAKYREAATQINQFFPDRIADFSALLNSDNDKVQLCCAVCMLELMQCSKEQSDLAHNAVLRHIEHTTDAAERTGLQIWLNNLASINK